MSTSIYTLNTTKTTVKHGFAYTFQFYSNKFQRNLLSDVITLSNQVQLYFIHYVIFIASFLNAHLIYGHITKATSS